MHRLIGYTLTLVIMFATTQVAEAASETGGLHRTLGRQPIDTITIAQAKDECAAAKAKADALDQLISSYKERAASTVARAQSAERRAESAESNSRAVQRRAETAEARAKLAEDNLKVAEDNLKKLMATLSENTQNLLSTANNLKACIQKQKQ